MTPSSRVAAGCDEGDPAHAFFLVARRRRCTQMALLAPFVAFDPGKASFYALILLGALPTPLILTRPLLGC